MHEIAQRLGMDPREAAMRLITLSGSGLPLLVGVECDPNGVRRALANAAAYGNYMGGPPSGPYAVHQSGPHPVQQQPYAPQGPVSQPFPAQPPPQATWGPPQSAGWVRADQPQPKPVVSRAPARSAPHWRPTASKAPASRSSWSRSSTRRTSSSPPPATSSPRANGPWSCTPR